jgi:glycosyltransferase involved in cell wall biosynthesis
MLGTRGIPANYGGFETFAEELCARLAERGHDVTVYCRQAQYDEPLPTYRGVRRVVLPGIHTKALDTLSHTFVATLHLLAHRADIAYYCNCANAWFMALPRLFGIRTLLNTDGLEWERAKWGPAAKTFYRISEHAASWFPHMLVSDSRVIQRYYREHFGCESEFVPYGADQLERGRDAGLVRALGVEPGEYFLYVSRLEPENNAHLLVEAFERVKTDKRLLVVGSAPFADAYIRRLHATTDPRILFPGGLYGETYKALQANAYAYVNAMEVGGTHPAILEAMGAGNAVLVSDIEYNAEAVGEAGLTFRNKDAADLREKLQWLADRPEEVARFGRNARARVSERYDWERVTDQYEQLFAALAAGGAPEAAGASREDS